MSAIMLIISNMVLNVVTVCGIVYVTTYFNKPALLWFLLLPFMNGLSLREKSGGKEEENEAEH